MAAINDLINRIQDAELRASIQVEVDKLSKQKKFGLVFEDHIPECTPLYEVPIRIGSLVAPKNGSVSDLHSAISPPFAMMWKSVRMKSALPAC